MLDIHEMRIDYNQPFLIVENILKSNCINGYWLLKTEPTGTSPYGVATAGTSPYGVATTGTSPYGVATTGTSPYGVATTCNICCSEGIILAAGIFAFINFNVS